MQGGGPALLIGAYAETFEFFRQQVLAGVLHRVLVRGWRAEPGAGPAHVVRTGLLQEGRGGRMKRRRMEEARVFIDSSVSFGLTPLHSSV